jgi:hypothetical protein
VAQVGAGFLTAAAEERGHMAYVMIVRDVRDRPTFLGIPERRGSPERALM